MSKANLLDRRSVVSSLLKDRKGTITVGGLGASTYDIAAAGDHDRISICGAPWAARS